jgi:hypothetical protein
MQWGDGDCSIKNEHKALNRFRKLGIPTLKTKVEKVKTDFETVDALICERYDFGVHTIHDLDKAAVRKHLKPGHLKSLKRIFSKIKRKKLAIPDPQFLFRGESEVVLHDPNGLPTRWHKGCWTDTIIKDIIVKMEFILSSRRKK